MRKTIKSGVRQILCTIINKYKEKQEKREALLKQKIECLHTVTEFIGYNKISWPSMVKTNGFEKSSAVERVGAKRFTMPESNEVFRRIIINDRNKKADQETQSPVTQVFKEIMQLSENANSEKANLLNQKPKKKRRFGFKSKGEKSPDSSNSERLYKVLQQRQTNSSHHKSQSEYLGEKRGSGWVWNVAEGEKNLEDTCSCVSCAEFIHSLKKLLMSQRSGCLLCIVATLVIVGAMAICCILKSLPKTIYIENKMAEKELQKADRTTSVPASERRDRRSEYGYGKQGIHDGPTWDVNKVRLMAELNSAGLSDNHADAENVQSHGRMNSELSSIIDSNKLGEGYRSSAIREFYQKLIKTDLEISKLKKSIRDTTTLMADRGNGMLGENFRPRRSLQYLPEKQNGVPIDSEEIFRKLNIYFPPATAIRIPEKNKRQIQLADGKIAKKKKKAVKAKSRFWRRFFKSRKMDGATTPDNSHSKNSEQLDKIIDKFIDKKKTRGLISPKTQTSKKNKLRSTIQLTTQQYEHTQNIKENDIDAPVSIDNEPEEKQAKKKSKKVKNKLKRYPDVKKTTTPSYSGALSISTILQSPVQPSSNNMELQVPNLRKLLQLDGGEDIEGAETVDAADENRDDEDGEKRSRSKELDMLQLGLKYRLTDINNPNWKGPMPLYPDELNTIIKNSALANLHTNKVSLSDNGKDLSDTEYVEDYVNNKYDKLAKMAQAYSDYGVLENNKKEIRHEKNPKHLDDKVKVLVQRGLTALGEKNPKHLDDKVSVLMNRGLTALGEKNPKHLDGKVLVHRGLTSLGEKNPKHSDDKVKMLVHRGLTALGRRKNSKTGVVLDTEEQLGEGIRFEIKPIRKEIPPQEPSFFKLASHVKIAGKKKVTLPKAEENYELFNSGKGLTPHKLSKHPTDTPYNDDHSWSHFGNNYKRSLKSVIDDANDDEKDNVTVVDDIMGHFTEADELKKATYNYNYTENVLSATAAPIDAADETLRFGVFNRKEENEMPPSNLFTIDSTNDLDNYDGSMNDNASYVNDVVSTSTETHEVLRFISDFFLMLDNINVHGKESWNKTCAFHDHEEKLKLTTPLPYTLHDISSTTSKYGSTLIDPEVVPNVGHRSRVLMSLKEDKQKNVTVVPEHIDEVISIKIFPLQIKVKRLNTTTEGYKLNVSSTDDNVISLPDYPVVKRSIPENSNQIFWNDMYDEEYGVKDPLENSVRDKPSEKSEDLMAKSGNWLGVKFRKIGDRVRNSYGRMMAVQMADGGRHNKMSKRADPDSEILPTFESLNAKMETVCKEAAEAVHKTRNMQVRSETDEAQALMKQLINMMSDLVEVQVKKRTCVALPADLRSFLRKLTTANVEDTFQGMPSVHRSSPFSINGGLSEGMQHSSEDVYPDVRTECLGTIHNVQQLIELYDEMSEEDKSKMSGVREYLETQLDFLHRQLSFFDDYALPLRFFDSPIRRRRLSKNAKKNRRVKRKIHKFINFGRKRTKSPMTDESYETLTNSYKSEEKILKKEEKSGKIEKYGSKRHSKEVKDGVTKDDEVKEENAKMKRNLQDIYYRALAEANNVTTASSLNTNTSN